MSFFGVFVFVFFFPLFSFSFSFGCCSGVVVCGWLFVGVSLLGLWFVLAFSIVYLSSVCVCEFGHQRLKTCLC